VAKVSSPEGITLGVSLIGLGTLWTLSNLGDLDLLATLHTWWPVVLLLWGLIELGASLHRRLTRPAPAAANPRWDAVERKLDEVSQLTDELAGRDEGPGSGRS
jgi:hypothetical protein